MDRLRKMTSFTICSCVPIFMPGVIFTFYCYFFVFYIWYYYNYITIIVIFRFHSDDRSRSIINRRNYFKRIINTFREIIINLQLFNKHFSEQELFSRDHNLYGSMASIIHRSRGQQWQQV